MNIVRNLFYILLISCVIVFSEKLAFIIASLKFKKKNLRMYAFNFAFTFLASTAGFSFVSLYTFELFTVAKYGVPLRSKYPDSEMLFQKQNISRDVQNMMPKIIIYRSRPKKKYVHRVAVYLTK